MSTYNVKTARLSLLIIFPSEPGLISQSCRKKKTKKKMGLIHFCTELIYVTAVFAICQTLLLLAQLWL